MNGTTTMARRVCCVFLCVVFCIPVWNAMGQNITGPAEAGKIQEKKEASAKARREAIEKTKAKAEVEIAKLSLPEDTSPRLTVKELRISGNTLITTDDMLKDTPSIFNASDKPLQEAESADLFDLRVLQGYNYTTWPASRGFHKDYSGFYPVSPLGLSG